MKIENSPFQTAWMSFDLGLHRPCDGTYCFYDYDSLPPIPAESTFVGKFEWLSIDPQVLANIHAQVGEDALASKLAYIKAEAQRLNIALPQGFEAFMGNEALRESIPSCTACYFDLSDKFIPAPIEEGGYFLRFLNDQQNILLWYLYLAPSGEHCVVVSNIYFDDEDYINSIPEEAVKRSTGYCAPSFEAFLYRFWIENAIWFGLEGEGLTASQQAYVHHYQAQN